jgi:dolichyl-phosphate-mannose-protein mannosyltransferase
MSTGWISAVERRETQARTRIILLVTGLALACGGQAILLHTNGTMADEGRRQLLAGMLMISGALCFGFAARQEGTGPARLDFSFDEVTPAALAWRSPWTLGWTGAALALALVDVWLFSRGGENPRVVMIWLVSIVLLFVGQLPGGLRLPRIAREERPYLLGLALVLLVALVSRIYHLTTLPYNLDGDFAQVGLEARALATGAQRQIFGFGWAAVPWLGYLPPWVTMKLFGPGLAGLNASGAIEGIFIIIGVYLLGRDLFSPRVGLLAAALLTVSEALLAASRQSSYIDPPFFLVFAIYFLLLGLREGRGWAIVLSALFASLCFQMYHSGKLVVPITGFVLLFLLLFHWRWMKARWWALVLWLISILIVFGPMLVVFAQKPADLAERSREVFIFNPDVVNHEKGVYGVDTVPGILGQQARRTLLLFNYYQDKGTQFGVGRPLLDPYLGVLFVLGLGWALFLARRLGNALLLGWIFLGLLLGSFLTANSPFWPRLIILLPPAALLAAQAADVLYDEARRGLDLARPAAYAVPVVTAFLILGIGAFNWSAYVEVKGSWATPRTTIGRYLADLPPTTHAYLVSNDYTYTDREFEFLAPGYLVRNLSPDEVTGDLQRVGEPTLLILTREQEPLRAKLETLYPGGTLLEHPGNMADEVAFYSFQLP